MRDFKVSLVQCNARLADSAANFQEHLKWLRKAVAHGSELVLFPEQGISGHVEADRCLAERCAEPVPAGPYTRRFVELAQQYRIHMCFGLVEKAGRDLYNTQVLVGPDGYIGKQRKIHNGKGQKCGRTVRVFATPLGRIGIAICLDNQYAEQTRRLAEMGMEILLMPHAATWHEPYSADRRVQAKVVAFNRTVNFDRIFKARCYENAVYGLYCNQVGLAEHPAGGGSLHHMGVCAIIDPSGQTVAMSRARAYTPEILHGTLKASVLKQFQPSAILHDPRRCRRVSGAADGSAPCRTARVVATSRNR